MPHARPRPPPPPPGSGTPRAARGTGRGGAVRPGAAEEDEGESAARGTWLCEPSACPGETRCSRGGTRRRSSGRGRVARSGPAGNLPHSKGKFGGGRKGGGCRCAALGVRSRSLLAVRFHPGREIKKMKIRKGKKKKKKRKYSVAVGKAPRSPTCRFAQSRPRAVRATGEEGVPLRAALPGTSRCPRLSAAGAEAAGAPRCPGGCCCCCCDRCPERGAVLRWPPLDRGLLSIPSATRADGCNLNFRLHFKRASLMLECRGERGKGTD